MKGHYLVILFNTFRQKSEEPMNANVITFSFNKCLISFGKLFGQYIRGQRLVVYDRKE